MGMLFRMLAPKPLKKARRVAHPVSMVTPRPVKRATGGRQHGESCWRCEACGEARCRRRGARRR